MLLEPFSITDPTVYSTGGALFACGVLASAAGMGGGAFYVTILMFVGGITPHDAVPISKGVIFLGSLTALSYNVLKRHPVEGGSIIDMKLVQMTVPLALGGTMFGVLLLNLTPAYLLTGILAAIVTFVTFKTFRGALNAHMQEKMSSLSSKDEAEDSRRYTVPHFNRDELEERNSLSSPLLGHGPLDSALQSSRVIVDCLLMSLLLVAVILLGYSSRQYPHSRHAAKIRGGMCFAAFLLSVWLHGYFVVKILKEGGEDWTLPRCCIYGLVAFVAGIFSGLVGIGAGIIFSPFFLLMHVEPLSAVASAATCVLFTSTSTTAQYALMGRIPFDRAVVYGIVAAASSSLGVRWAASLTRHRRRSYLIFIVAIASGLMAVLLVVKVVIDVAPGVDWGDWGLEDAMK
ncbi:unnamed protein product [Vitrella brassicaformis CCMP3155]|uniref:Uncharacterized protein n=1 Tax=Vitrella brassicaformis (strain CCMP3155) TaxID=1169540 RepID=A0A0G4F6M5_VITBC|nr:unnamed protein product [Vitrella brassicaformis CCMP3155]|eukprot:CEM07898.1 unnamed protein product [Vitrella brassicaformis CCMP3155]